MLMGFLFLSLKNKNFLLEFFFSEFKLGFFKKMVKWLKFKVRVCKFVLQRVPNNFFLKNII